MRTGARQTFHALLVSAFLFFPGRFALADPPDATPADTKAAGLSLYEQGIKHYHLGEYDEAIAAFRRGYLLTSAPEFLYDLAQSYRLKGPPYCAQALQLYRSYLNVAPATPKRAAVEAAISDMETCASTAPRAQAPPAPPSPEPGAIKPAASPEVAPRTRGSGPGWITWVVAGTGAALLVAGGALLLSYQLDYDTLHDSGCAPSCDPTAVDGLRTRRTAGYVLATTGAATLGAAIVLWITARPGPTTQISASVRPSLGGVEGTIRF